MVIIERHFHVQWWIYLLLNISGGGLVNRQWLNVKMEFVYVFIIGSSYWFDQQRNVTPEKLAV